MKEKKKILKRTISRELIPLKNETWLTQPLTVTMMRHDFSMVQNRVFIQIVSSLQKQIKIRLSTPNYVQLDLFEGDNIIDPEDKTKIAIKIEYKSISSENNYFALENALRMLSHIPVEIPAKVGKRGTEWLMNTNLCTVYIEKKQRYNKFAVVKIDKDVAEKLISTDFGYSKLGKEIVEQVSNKFAQRIYMMMTSWSQVGKCTKNTLDLRKSLRLEDKYVNSYVDFEKRVLKTAADELKSLYDDGYCDLWFEYSPNYEKGQKRRDYPPTISFIIHTEEEKKLIENVMTEQQKQSLIRMLETHLKIPRISGEKIVAKATNYSNIATKICELADYVKKHGNEIKNVHSYLVASFDAYFNEDKKENKDNNTNLI